jgi:hypothetical protein
VVYREVIVAQAAARHHPWAPPGWCLDPRLVAACAAITSHAGSNCWAAVRASVHGCTVPVALASAATSVAWPCKQVRLGLECFDISHLLHTIHHCI